MNSLKYNEKNVNFIKRSKFAKREIICFCTDVFKFYEADDSFETFDVLSTLNGKKPNCKKKIVEKNNE